MKRPLLELRVRTCMSMHRCCVCLATIKLGEGYHDGGYPRRAHEVCAKAVLEPTCKAREHTRTELRELDRAELAAATERGRKYRAKREEAARKRRGEVSS